MQQFRGQEYESGNQTTVDISSTSSSVEEIKSSGFSVTKVILWLGIGLLITGVVSMSIPDLLILLANQIAPESVSGVYLGVLVASIILMLPSAIIVGVQAFRKNKPLIITSYVCYSVFMGVFLSSVMLTLFYDEPTSFIRTIGVSFLSTAVVFSIIGIISMKAKINHPLLLTVLSSLAIGITTLVLVYVFVRSNALSVFIDAGMLLYMLLIMVLDFNRVKRIAEGSEGLAEGTGTNMAIFCAFNLYVDFIYLFLRVLYFVAALSKHD